MPAETRRTLPWQRTLQIAAMAIVQNPCFESGYLERILHRIEPNGDDLGHQRSAL